MLFYSVNNEFLLVIIVFSIPFFSQTSQIVHIQHNLFSCYIVHYCSVFCFKPIKICFLKKSKSWTYESCFKYICRIMHTTTPILTESILSLHRAWRCVRQRGNIFWAPMCTQRPPMEAGDGLWPWPSS